MAAPADDAGVTPYAQGQLLAVVVQVLFFAVLVHVARTVHGSWRAGAGYGGAAVLLWFVGGVLVALLPPLTAATAVAVRQHVRLRRQAA